MHPYLELGFCKIPVFSIFLVSAVFICIMVFLKNTKYDNFYYYGIKKAMVFAMFFAGIGGKGLFAITQLGSQQPTITSLFGGFVYYGGFVGAVIGIAIYSAAFKERFLDLTDVFTSLLPLGQAVGRFGCFFNGCCYGMVYDGFLSLKYPIAGQFVGVFPTWFFETFFCLLIFFYFQRIKKRKKSGFYTSIYMITYSIFRFFIEYLRGDEIRGIWGVLSTSQIISILVFISGIVIGIYSKLKMGNNMMLKGRREGSDN